MYPSDRNLNGMQRRTLYMLERQYGGTVDYYRLNGSTTDIESGVKTLNRTVVRIPRAVVLPTKITREQVNSISKISANKKFVQGGGFDTGTKYFVIRGHYLDSLGGAQQDDWLVYKNRRFDIVTIEEYEFNGSYLLTCKEIKGAAHSQIKSVGAKSYLELTEVNYLA